MLDVEYVFRAPQEGRECFRSRHDVRAAMFLYRIDHKLPIGGKKRDSGPIRCNGDIPHDDRRRDRERPAGERHHEETQRLTGGVRKSKQPFAIWEISNPLVFETIRWKLLGVSFAQRDNTEASALLRSKRQNEPAIR